MGRQQISRASDTALQITAILFKGLTWPYLIHSHKEWQGNCS